MSSTFDLERHIELDISLRALWSSLAATPDCESCGQVWTWLHATCNHSHRFAESIYSCSRSSATEPILRSVSTCLAFPWQASALVTKFNLIHVTKGQPIVLRTDDTVNWSVCLQAKHSHSLASVVLNQMQTNLHYGLGQYPLQSGVSVFIDSASTTNTATIAQSIRSPVISLTGCCEQHTDLDQHPRWIGTREGVQWEHAAIISLWNDHSPLFPPITES